MDNLLNSFFSNFAEDMEEHRLSKERINIILEEISVLIETEFNSNNYRTPKKPRKFQNPYLYYRIDLKNIASVGSIADDIIDFFDLTNSRFILDDYNQYIVYNAYPILPIAKTEDYLLVRIVSSKNGTSAIELMIISDPSVILYKNSEVGIRGDLEYDVLYFIDGELFYNTFYPLLTGKYHNNDIIFIPDLESKNPFDSVIIREQ